MSTVITKDIVKCKQLLQDGQLVAIPTETVYGLAANALDEKAVEAIFKMKARPRFNPLILHIHSLQQLEQYATQIPKNAIKLANAFWPGSLTLVLPKQAIVPKIITAGKPTVGLRMPNHALTLALLKELPFPLAAPSANPFTRISPTSAQHVADYFGKEIPAILDGGSCKVGLESTIVGFNGEMPIIYRKGGIAIQAIEKVVGKASILTENETAPQAPGMLLKHYSPKTKLIITHNVKKVLLENPKLKIGVLAFQQKEYEKASAIKLLSENGKIDEAAQHLYACLHELDMMNLDLILVEPFPEEGLGMSINDRLKRAAF